MNKKSFFTILLLLLIALLITFPNLCLDAAQDGLLLWFNKVLPSLLPFMIFINLLIPLDGMTVLAHQLDPLTRRFWHLPGYSFLAFLTGLIASYPMGAKTVKTLFKEGKLSKEDASLTLCFANNCGPLFIIATVGSAMFGSTRLGYFLLFIHIASALIISFLITRHYPLHAYSSSSSCTSPVKLTALLNQGVMNAMETILCVGGYIILFSVLLTLLTRTPLFFRITETLWGTSQKTDYLRGILAGILEISNGCHTLSQLQPFSVYLIGLVSSTISFGGLCVFCQTLYVLDDQLNTIPYLISKAIQAIISFALTLIFYPFYVMYTTHACFQFHFYHWALALILGIISYWLLQFMVTGKINRIIIKKPLCS